MGSGGCYLDTVEFGGSKLPVPTIKNNDLRLSGCESFSLCLVDCLVGGSEKRDSPKATPFD